MRECFYDADGCLVCPEQEAQTYIPSRVEQRAVLGWNAGANSIATVDSDLHAVMDQPLGVVGVIMGLKGVRTQQTIPSQIEHGWYFQRVGGVDVVQPIERGQVLAPLITDRTDSTLFEIRRTSGVVSYLRDGVLVATSAVRSAGAKVLNCCMYASGDTAPGV
jgi:hypothetical protein